MKKPKNKKMNIRVKRNKSSHKCLYLAKEHQLYLKIYTKDRSLLYE